MTNPHLPPGADAPQPSPDPTPGPDSTHRPDSSGGVGTATPPPPAGEQHGEQSGEQSGGPYGRQYDGAGPRVTTDEMRDLGRLRRSVTNRRVGGVAGGLARHFDVDPIIVRVLLVVLAFFGGAGLIVYAAVWILVPEEGSNERPFGLDDRSRGTAMIITGVLAGLAVLGAWSGGVSAPWGVVVLLLAVGWLVTRGRRNESPLSSGYGSPGAPMQHASYAAQPGMSASEPTPTWAPTSPSYAAPPPTAWPAQAYAPPPNPRRRGPILFWPAVALIAVGVGILGLVDLSGVNVVSAAYPALALGITAAMLLVGAFWGRAGGLILIGLLATAVTGIASAADHFETKTVRLTPTTASQIEDAYTYSFDDNADQFVLDLTRVGDPEELAGREIDIDGFAGEIEVVVPAGLAVEATADVGAGDATVFDHVSTGVDNLATGSVNTAGDTDPLTINIDLAMGQVTVREQGMEVPR